MPLPPKQASKGPQKPKPKGRPQPTQQKPQQGQSQDQGFDQSMDPSMTDDSQLLGLGQQDDQNQDPSMQQTDPSMMGQQTQDPMASQGPPTLQSAVPMEDYDLPFHTIDGFPMPQQGHGGDGIIQPGGTPEVGRLTKPEWWAENDMKYERQARGIIDEEGDDSSPWPMPMRKLDQPSRTIADVNDDLIMKNRVEYSQNQDDMNPEDLIYGTPQDDGPREDLKTRLSKPIGNQGMTQQFQIPQQQMPMAQQQPPQQGNPISQNWINSPDMTGNQPAEEQQPPKKRATVTNIKDKRRAKQQGM
jgi:hypothetical protein